MKHILILFILALPTIGLAGDISTKSPAAQQDVISIEIKHRINGGDFLQAETISLPIKKFKSEPSLLLRLIRDNLSNQLKVLPVQINTELELLLDQVKLPTMSITTNVAQDGNGISDVILPASKFSNNGTLVDWKGLKSHITFASNFANLTADTKIAKITVTEKNKQLISLDHIDIYSSFDADLRPSKLQAIVPSFQAKENDNSLNLQDLIATIDIKKLASGLEIGNLVLQLKHIDFTEYGITTSLNNLSLTTDTKELNNVINFNLKTNADKIELPANIGSSLGSIEQTGDISLLNLDADSLLSLQTKFHKLHDNPMAAIIMLGELMEIAPNVLAKSPKIKLNQLLIKTEKGNLQGEFTIGLDGEKAKSLAIPVLFNALIADANLTISKKLLEQAMINQFQSSDDKKSVDDAKIAAKEQIKTYLESKMLVEVGDNYQLIASFSNGKLLVNKQEMSLPLQ